MKEYIKLGVGIYIGMKIAKAVDRFLVDICGGNNVDENEE